ncbi:ParA family protein [Pengzhenrongella sicca]|uniref:ParA family protein n=1 Tax=Pengzhenrongella sicca TaxID=2819238 RepID=A0A8A4Z7H7_9MICO|nr:ParA family protein [Pengzhenrongella sicca]QTE27850.1 ParA family protein [Pengzhenrongella sicca]
MLVLGICSLKGGVGKTSVTLGLASAALQRGIRTLVIDLDPQADATMALAAQRADRLDVATVLDDPRAWSVERSIGASGWATTGLDVMLGSARSADHDGPGGEDLERLAFALSFVGEYDLVLIDCPPSLGGLTRAGLTAADRAVVVTEPGLFAVMAVGRALRTIDELRRGPARRLQPLGVVVNRVQGRSSEQAFRLEELRATYGPLVLSPEIPERSVLQQAQGAGRSVHSWPGKPAAELARAFDLLLDRALRSPHTS